MSDELELYFRWRASRFLHEMVAAQPDGRILLFAGKINWVVGVLLGCSLALHPISPRIGWVHVVLFLGMPLVGFVWFIRGGINQTRPTALSTVDCLFQLFPALFPWFKLIQDLLRTLTSA